MSFDSSSSSMLTPTEMRTSSEKPRGWTNLVDLNEEKSKLVDLNEEKSEVKNLNEEKSEVWRNIFQERFDRRTGGNCSKEPFFPVLVIFNKILLFLLVPFPGGICQSAN